MLSQDYKMKKDHFKKSTTNRNGLLWSISATSAFQNFGIMILRHCLVNSNTDLPCLNSYPADL